MSELRLYILADDPLVRAGLAGLLFPQEGCLIVGQSNFADFWSDVDELALDTDVVLWDFGWDGSDVVPSLGDIDLPVVVLVDEDTAVSELWAAGLRHLIHRQSDAEAILVTAQAAINDLIVLAPDFVELLHLNPEQLDTAVIPDLTPREKEVLNLVAEGLTNKAIARQLDISDHTVKFHINALMSKLDAQSRTEAVVKATRFGLILL